MHRLFWKIFVSFWLALIVFSGAVMFAASNYLEQMRTEEERGPPMERFVRYHHQAQMAADRGGVQGLKAWAEDMDRREATPLLLLDEQGQDLLGRPVSPSVTARLNRERMHDEREPQFRPPPIRPPLIRLADGSRYLYVPDFQSVTLGRILNRPRVIAVPVLIAALVSALACLLLSRYLTLPLERLRRTTQQFAAGDLTQRVTPGMGKRKDEIADLALAFDKMAERLEKVFGAQRQLLRDASHELRSPLARLQVALALARQRASGADKELDRIERETERLNELIGRLLSLSRLEAGVDSASVEAIDLPELLQSLVEDARFEATARGCRVTLHETVPAIVTANALWLHSALENVVRNAIKYTKEGTDVEISLRNDTAKPGWIAIRVRDHGPGVPEEALPHLFEPFVRVGEARDRASGGYGLGLAIADRAVRLFGGEITARNEPGGGLSVLIRLRKSNTNGPRAG
jgi:two-component system sensor histidine kinase CpxA